MIHDPNDNLISDRSIITLITFLTTTGIWIYVFYLIVQNTFYADTIDPRIKQFATIYMVGYVELVIGIMLATLITLLVRNHSPKKELKL